MGRKRKDPKEVSETRRRAAQARWHPALLIDNDDALPAPSQRLVSVFGARRPVITDWPALKPVIDRGDGTSLDPNFFD